MENTTPDKVKAAELLQHEDLRQSEKWEQYLATLGWKVYKTPNGVGIETIKSGLMDVSKVQRPHPLTEIDFREIDEYCEKNKVAFVKVEPHFNQDLTEFAKRGYVVSSFPLIPPSTILIELNKSEEELWQALSHSAKYSINRAKRENAKVEIVSNPSLEQIEAFNSLAMETGKRKGFFVQSVSEIKSKAELFAEECFIIFVYDGDGVLSSGKFFVGHKKVIWYLHGGTSLSGKKNKDGYLMMWEAFKHFKKLGYEIFDLEGIEDKRFPFYTKNWAGLTHFKRKFGGVEVMMPSPRVKIYSPILKTLNRFMPMPL